MENIKLILRQPQKDAMHDGARFLTRA